MKKFIVLFILSVFIILIILGFGYTRIENIQYVKGTTLCTTAAVDRVEYGGVLEYAGSLTSSARGSGIVQSVFVENGSFVEKGDPVAAVCETYEEISASDISSALSSNGIDALSSMISGNTAVNVYTAPGSGYISDLDIEIGSFFTKGQALFKVSDKKTYQVQLTVSEKDISAVKPGQSVSVDCRALPCALAGTVSSVADAAKQTSSQLGKITGVKVVVAIDEQSDALKTGFTADCSILTRKDEDKLLAPYSAVAEDESGTYVWVSKGGEVSKRPVGTGREYSNGVEILSGVSSGDVVVLCASQVGDPSNTVVNTLSNSISDVMINAR